MTHFLFTSESVAIGHPDKVADQISDAILDACLEQDPFSRVACETLVSGGLVVLAGEITTTASFDYREVVRKTIREIGYHDPNIGFDFRSCGIISSINKQSPEIAAGVGEGIKELGAGDQGLMFGYACDETPELMPMPIMIANSIVRKLKEERESKRLPYLRPDAKTQVTVEYDENHKPVRIHTIVISTQHAMDIDQESIRQDMIALIATIVPKKMLDRSTRFFINPSGSFILGGPTADCGLTGRKIIVDTYGGMGRHGGGAFSGKDPTKVDRSAGYAARYVAKNIVAAGLAKRCEVQLSYAIGESQPIAVHVESFGTHTVPIEEISHAVLQTFDLSPQGIIETLDLRRPIYRNTAFGGHFGRNDPDFTWEKTDQMTNLINSVSNTLY